MVRGIDVELSAVIVAVTDDEPRILSVPGVDPTSGERRPALPSGTLDPDRDRTLDRALRRWVREQAGLDVGHVEQLYTFGDRYRHPRESDGGSRLLSVAYLALVREEQPSAGAAWRPWYDLFPWEDHRDGPPPVLEATIEPALQRWIAEGEPDGDARRERALVNFALEHSRWDPLRALERYELLYELRLVAESGDEASLGDVPLILDHRRIAATALGRIRGKLSYRPVVFELLPETFTLLRLQRIVESLHGVRLHKQNFRRLVERGGLVEATGERDASTGGRPAALFRFRREVVLERLRPGLGVPPRPRG